jgi:hypothetical protein
VARLSGGNPKKAKDPSSGVGKGPRSKETPITGRHGRFGYFSGFRPPRHRWIGIALLVGGFILAVLNDAMWFTEATLLPFGHQEIWLLSGVALAGWGVWFLGLFDPTARRRRAR